MSNFETWWEREGQEFLFALNTTTDDDIKLVAEVAWKNGAYCAEQAEQPVSQEYQDHLVNQSFDWAAMAAKHQLMEGYRIGLAEMREKCAKVVESGVLGHGECAAAIRAINFEGDTGFRPVSEMVAEHKQDPKKAAAIEKAKMRKAEQEPVAWMWKMHGWVVTAHGKHQAIKRYVDICKPPLETQQSDDFIELIQLYAAPVSVEAIRSEALEEAAKVCEAKQSYNAMHANTDFAAAIRGLK